jgi:hypothetical protein
MNTPHKDNTKLTHHDLQFALLRSPRALLTLMKLPKWRGKIFVGGGFLRSVVSGDPVNDVDVFVSQKELAWLLARELIITRMGLKPEGPGDIFSQSQETLIKSRIHETDNALTLARGFSPTVQIIHRWTFDSGNAAANSFDFTCCAAMFWYGKDGFGSYCDTRFYPDVAAKRLIYRSPVRNEDAGGSMLRVLKYYQKGYRIPLDSLSAVITRLVRAVDLSKCTRSVEDKTVSAFVERVDEPQFSKVICGLLREVDPNVDPSHVAHLPAETDECLDTEDNPA